MKCVWNTTLPRVSPYFPLPILQLIPPNRRLAPTTTNLVHRILVHKAPLIILFLTIVEMGTGGVDVDVGHIPLTVGAIPLAPTTADRFANSAPKWVTQLYGATNDLIMPSNRILLHH